jgi:hypothetical protein
MSAPSVVSIPRGIADTRNGSAYVVGPEGKILALKLADGAVLARTEFAATPLAFGEGMLVGWRNVGDRTHEIRLFAAKRRGNSLRIKWERALQVPDWVAPGSVESDAFSLSAKLVDDGLVVIWEAHGRYQGGAPPPPDIEQAAIHDERRTIRLDRETGTPLGQETSELLPSAERALPAFAANRTIVPYRLGRSWLTHAWRTDSVDAVLVSPPSEPGIMLARRTAGSTAIPTETQLTRDPAAKAMVTPDGRFVFIHEPGDHGPTWQVFSAETAERITSLPLEPGTEEVAVVSQKVVYLVVEDLGTTRRRSLRSRDLATGDAIWSQVLDEQIKRAPPPPPP